MSGSEEEFVGFGGGPDRPDRPSLVERLRTQPWLIALIVLAVLIGGVGVVAYQRANAPDLPMLSARLTQPSGEPGEDPGPSTWQAGLDARPAGPVELQGEYEVSVSSPGGGPIELFGIDGPGVTLPDSPVARLAPGESTITLDADTVIDCDEVKLPVARDAYGVAVRVTEGAETARGTVDVGEAAAGWADEVTTACGSWLARTHLTVTAADVAPDATRPRAEVAMTFTNRGTADAYVATQDTDRDDIRVTTVPAGTLVVRAGRSAQLSATVVIDRCDLVAAIQTVGNGTGVPVAVTSDVIDVYGTVGREADAASYAPAWTTGLGPTSIVFAPDAARELSDGMRAACGGVEGLAALVQEGGTRYDAAAKVLSVRLVLAAPSERIRDVRLVASAADFGPNAFRPVAPSSARLVPDSTGRIETTVRYRAPEALRLCPSPELFLPGFDLVVRVAAGEGLRTVRFSTFAVQWDDAVVRRQICP